MPSSCALTLDDTQHTFVTLIEQHRGILFKVARAYGRSDHATEDLIQEIACHLWQAFPGYDPTRRFSTWMYRIALNVAISQRRRERRSDRHFEPLDSGVVDIHDPRGTNVEGQQQIELLNQVIASLAPLDRAVVLLYLDQCSTREISEVLGLSESNVTTKLSRLKARIREQLSSSSPTSPQL